MIENEDQEFEGRAPVRTEGGEEKEEKERGKTASPCRQIYDLPTALIRFMALFSYIRASDGGGGEDRRAAADHTWSLSAARGFFFAEEYAHPSNLFLLSLALNKKKTLHDAHVCSPLTSYRNATRRMGPPHPGRGKGLAETPTRHMQPSSLH